MNSEEKKIIIKKYQYLVENIRADKLCPYLIQAGAIDLDDKSVILSKPDQTSRASELVDCLCKSRSPDAFQAFLQSLKESGWEFVESELTLAFKQLQVSSKSQPKDVKDPDTIDGNAGSSMNGNDDDCQCIDTASGIVIFVLASEGDFFLTFPMFSCYT